MTRFIGDVFGIVTMIITVAIVAVLVSKKSQTSEVITSFANALSKLLATVVGPVGKGS